MGAAASAETVGRFARAAGWPVLADPISGLRTGANAVSAYEALLRVPDFADGHRPEVVLRIGAPLTGKVATSWLDPSIMQIVVDPDASWLDPHRAASERVECCAEALLTSLAERLDSDRPLDDTEWLDDWLGAEAAARAAIDPLLDAGDAPFEGRVARDVFAALPAGAACFVAPSMPVRDAEWFAAPRDGLRMYANRG
ncbi:MAG: hypothetical protein M5T61_03660 [Acidimicrobiia bacterium]|nr:hypothetical protein [Acidimicrobiia bacterium]